MHNKKYLIKNGSESNFNDILDLNEELVHYLSHLDEELLKKLAGDSELFYVVEEEGKTIGFLLAFREGKGYKSPNYVWFCENYEKFLYIDRIVVSPKYQGMKIGELLYNAAFEHGKKLDISHVTAEIDIEPPNPGSLKFHEKFGFKEVGTLIVANGTKKVSLQASKIDK